MSYATAPGINDLYISALTNTTATIEWKTNKPGDSQVFYHEGLNADTSVLDSSYVLNHSITLTSLTLGTMYYATVKSKDSLGNISTSNQMQFVTTGGTGVKPDSNSLTVVGYALSYTGLPPQEAVWIEDSNGNFIKTLFVSNKAIMYNALPTWSSRSGNVTNGNTGASKVAGSYTASWNCTDINANSVDPGNYKYCIEVNQENNPSALLTCFGTITLGNTSSSSSGNTGGFITSLSAAYTP